MRTVLFAIIFSLVTSLTAAPPKKWKRITRPHRAYYPELSDSEFKSLNPGPNYLVYFVDTWLNRPLKNNDFLFEYYTHTKDDAVAFQKRLYTTFKDIRVQGRGITELRLAKNPTASSLLLDILKSSSDYRIQTDCLLGIAQFKGQVSENDLKPYLSAKDVEVQSAAARVYSIQSYAKASKLFELAKTLNPYYRAAVIGHATDCANKATFNEWQAAIGSDTKSLINALPGMLLANPPESFIAKLQSHDDVAVRASLVKNLETLPATTRDPILQAMSKDNVASIRALIAKAIGTFSSKAALPQLLALSEDKTINVQLETAASLSKFATPAAVQTLIKLTGRKESQLVQDKARESLYSLHGRIDIDGPLGKAVASNNRFIRLHAYTILDLINSTAHGEAISKSLRKETEAENIAAGINALVTAKGDQAERQVMEYTTHKSVDVRAAVWKSIGKQKWKQHYKYIMTAAGKKNISEVRQAAFYAIGLTGDKVFCPVIIWALKQTSVLSEVASNDRAAACWACARIDGITEEIINRLYVQVSVPVVTGPGAPPMFESDSVRTQATLALLKIAENSTGAKKELATRLGNTSLGLLNKEDDGGGTMPTSPQLRYCAYQIKQLLAGKAIDRAPRRPSKFRFNLSPAKK